MTYQELNAQKAKKATGGLTQYLEALQSGFYSFLIIGRAVTVHCFLADLESAAETRNKKTMNCKIIIENSGFTINLHYFKIKPPIYGISSLICKTLTRIYGIVSPI